jgi:hypothetical protein
LIVRISGVDSQAEIGRRVRSGRQRHRPLEGVACPDLFCLLVLTVVLPAFRLLTDLDRANTAPTLATVQATSTMRIHRDRPDLWLAAEVRDDDRAQLADAATHAMRVPPAGGG